MISPWRSCKSRRPAVNCLRDSSADWYCECRSQGCFFLVLKKALREGACSFSVREPVLRLPRGNYRGEGAGVLARGRQPRSAPAFVEDHRGKGGRRPPDHACGLPQGSDPERRERAVDPRSAPHLHRQLSATPGASLFRAAAPFAFAVLVTGCELGPRDEASAHGPPLHILATYPTDGQGTDAAQNAPLDCDSPTPDCPLPTNLAIELRFDRFLLPGDRIGAGLRLYTGDPDTNSVALSPEYNLIERVVVFRPQRALHPNTLYTAEVVTTTDPNRGFWAFDRAPLREGTVPLRFSFTTGSGPVQLAAPPVLPAETCETMINGPFASCANCHVTQPGDETVPPSPSSGITERLRYPPMGLDLSSPRGLYYTAIQHVAHQAETGNSVLNQGLESADRFGVQMNIVDPGNPANSYLMYKLLAKPDNYRF